MVRPSLVLTLSLALAGSLGAQTGVPPPVSIVQTSAQADNGLNSSGPLASGLIFITPAKGKGSSPAFSNGPLIIDNQGRPVWFMPLSGAGLASDLRVQTYLGNPVLTWSQGVGFENATPGATTDFIADSTYHVIASVQAGNGLDADQHEFYLTPQGTALITIYNTVTGDLSSVGGSTSVPILEGVFQEINVATGQVVFEWHSLDHVAVSETYLGAPTTLQPYDYFHINSVSLDTDGNFLVSSRHTWTVYKVNRTTGAVMWRLGGKKSDFALGTGLPFAFQHDAIAVDASTIRIFDNESNGQAVLPASRVIWVNHNDSTMTASITQSIQHPAGLSVLAEGSAQALPNGDTFVEWGILGRVSEFDSTGTLLFDATQSTGFGSYRGYRFPWTGNPATSPTVTAVTNADGSVTVHAIWNGATQVATWNVMGGASAGSLSSVGTAPWNGLDTVITLASAPMTLQVVALDASGATLGQSTALAGPFVAPPAITAQPVSQTIADGGTVVFSVAATGPGLTYSWNINPTNVGVPQQLIPLPSFTGTDGPTLVVHGANMFATGTYSCTVSNSAGTATSNAATLAVSTTADVGRLINISARTVAGSGVSPLIAGFVVGGGSGGAEPVLVRASGPALIPFQVPGTLADPELNLFSSAGPTLLAADSGWGGSASISAAATAVGAFAWNDPASLDSALLQSLAPGAYTAEITSASGDSGVALAEVYDDTPAGTFTASLPHLVNVSARATVGTDASVLIAGFVIGGSTSKTVLIRASGPALDPFGVTDTLSDPELQLFNAATTGGPIAVNDDWGGDPQVVAAASAVGAFAWTDPTSADSALLVTLAPGAYTAEITGIGNATGVALIEVYEIP